MGKELDWLTEVPLFQGLPDSQLAGLATIASERQCDRHETVFAEGEDSAGFFVVISGQVRVFKLSPDGREQILHIFGPGEPVGEVPVFTGEPYPAHAAAMKRSLLGFIPRDAFIELVKKDPTIALNMLAVLSKRLMRFTRMIEDLSLKEAPARLAAYLLRLQRRQGMRPVVELDIPKNQLANLLGTTPETLSRILAKLVLAGAVETVDNRHIRLSDEAFLDELSAGMTRLSG